jgi:hypothetical protein
MPRPNCSPCRVEESVRAGEREQRPKQPRAALAEGASKHYRRRLAEAEREARAAWRDWGLAASLCRCEGWRATGKGRKRGP